MHVTGFGAATILVFAIASPSRAQGIEVFGGYSINADDVQNRPAILVIDQKVSPFFSLGSGDRPAPIGSRERDRATLVRFQQPVSRMRTRPPAKSHRSRGSARSVP